MSWRAKRLTAWENWSDPGSREVVEGWKSVGTDVILLHFKLFWSLAPTWFPYQ